MLCFRIGLETRADGALLRCSECLGRQGVRVKAELQDTNLWATIQRFYCPNCSSMFGHRPSLARHLKYECGQAPRFECPYCQVHSKKTSDVYSHVRRRHPGLEVFANDVQMNLARKRN
ncbi:hypothetical protein KM043_007653 [Ampulex compressa]|nr:hypothetical protein KM043_007653 [Ampulex compressa]